MPLSTSKLRQRTIGLVALAFVLAPACGSSDDAGATKACAPTVLTTLDLPRGGAGRVGDGRRGPLRGAFLGSARGCPRPDAGRIYVADDEAIRAIADLGTRRSSRPSRDQHAGTRTRRWRRSERDVRHAQRPGLHRGGPLRHRHREQFDSYHQLREQGAVAYRRRRARSRDRGRHRHGGPFLRAGRPRALAGRHALYRRHRQ